MAPLGVLTAIAGAIRVGGASWLKRLVGRARENYANAEIDLMSSVSQEVCELWNGKSIVRSTGRPEIKQIIHLSGDISPKSFVTVEALKEDDLLKGRVTDANTTGSENSENRNSGNKDSNGDAESGIPEKSISPTDNENLPPNISLNIHGGSNPIELWVCATIATILQTAVLVWSAITAYSSYARKRSQLSGINPSIGFPLQAAGTVLLTLGLFLCAGIIDSASCEQHWPRQTKSRIMTVSRLPSFVRATFQAPANKQRSTVDQSSKQVQLRGRDMQLYWVQKQHTAGDNSFDPYILYAGELKSEVLESHRAEEKGQSDRDDASLEEKPKPYKWTTFAVVIGILGFLAQFQGLRFLNWTCSIAQLIALLVATILRAWVRRSMNKTPVAVPVNNDYILDNLALAIVGKGPSGSDFPSSEALRAPGLSLAFGVTAIPKLRPINIAGSKDQGQSGSVYSSRASLQPIDPTSQTLDNVQTSTEIETTPSLAQQALDLRVRLGRLTRWTGAKSQEAINLSNSIEAALERLSPQLPAEYGGRYAVVLHVNTYRNIPHAFREEVELYIIKDGDRWKVDDAQLEALLSLVSYSAWVAEQNRGKREETDKGKSPARLDSSGHSVKEQSIKDSRSIGWLRAKAPDSHIYHRVFGKSSPKLLSDLFWWTPVTEGFLDKVKATGPYTKSMVAVPRGFGIENASASETKPDKAIEQHALGFDVNNEASKETGKITIQLHLWRALTCPDTFWSSECTEQQALVLHLFSTFMWATMKFVVSASQFHPTTVTETQLPYRDGPSFFLFSRTIDRNFLSLPKVKSHELETLVQELQSTGLGTSEEIYRVLIPPLSYFDKLPNEAVADWCNERLIKLECSTQWHSALQGCVDLLEPVQCREVQDRFAKRAAAIVVGLFLRVIDDPNHEELSYESRTYNTQLRTLLRSIAKESVLRAVLSLKHIIADQGNQRRFSELEKLLQLEPGLSTQALEEIAPGENDLEEDDFTFPNATDVFGWTYSYRNAVKFSAVVPKAGGRQVLDLAGQSALHHVFDRTADMQRTNEWISHVETISSVTGKDELITARCNNQTPLHRAARAGHPGPIKELLEKGADPNAADSFGQTALFLAAYRGHCEVVNQLCRKMDPVARNKRDMIGRNALHHAIRNHQDIAAVLAQEQDQNSADPKRRKENAATATIQQKLEDVALALIDHGLDINTTDNWFGRPLWSAASAGMERVVKHLLSREELGSLTIRSPINGKFTTPEREAKRAGHEKIAKMIRDEIERREQNKVESESQGTCFPLPQNQDASQPINQPTKQKDLNQTKNSRRPVRAALRSLANNYIARQCLSYNVHAPTFLTFRGGFWIICPRPQNGYLLPLLPPSSYVLDLGSIYIYILYPPRT